MASHLTLTRFVWEMMIYPVPEIEQEWIRVLLSQRVWGVGQQGTLVRGEAGPGPQPCTFPQIEARRTQARAAFHPDSSFTEVSASAAWPRGSSVLSRLLAEKGLGQGKGTHSETFEKESQFSYLQKEQDANYICKDSTCLEGWWSGIRYSTQHRANASWTPAILIPERLGKLACGSQ